MNTKKLVLAGALVAWVATGAMAKEDRFFFLQIDGGSNIRIEAKAGTTCAVRTVELTAGVHAVRLSNPMAWAPDFDRLTICKRP